MTQQCNSANRYTNRAGLEVLELNRFASVRDSSMPGMKAKELEATESLCFQPACADNRPDKAYIGSCKNWLEPLFRTQTQQKTILKRVNAHFQTRSELLAWIETVKTAHTPRATDCVLSRWAASQLWAFISSDTHTYTAAQCMQEWEECFWNGTGMSWCLSAARSHRRKDVSPSSSTVHSEQLHFLSKCHPLYIRNDWTEYNKNIKSILVGICGVLPLPTSWA